MEQCRVTGVRWGMNQYQQNQLFLQAAPCFPWQAGCISPRSTPVPPAVYAFILSITHLGSKMPPLSTPFPSFCTGNIRTFFSSPCVMTKVVPMHTIPLTLFSVTWLHLLLYLSGPSWHHNTDSNPWNPGNPCSIPSNLSQKQVLSAQLTHAASPFPKSTTCSLWLST